MNDKRRLTIFGIIVAIIIIATIIIIVVNNSKKPVNEVPPSGNNANNEIQAPDVNKDAKPDDKPSIGGTDNVQNSNGKKTNTSAKLKENKTYNNCTFSDISLVFENGKTSFNAKVSSTSTEKVSGQDIKIKFLDKDGKYISAMNTYVPQIKPGVTVDLIVSSTSDLSNAYNFEIVAAQ